MPGGKGKITGNDNTNGFQKNPQNINRTGKNRKLVSNVIHDLRQDGVKETSQPEIKAIYLMLLNLTVDELTARVNDKDQPLLIRIVGKAVLGGKGFEIIEKMVDRSIGKPIQQIDSTVDGTTTIKIVREDA